MKKRITAVVFMGTRYPKGSIRKVKVKGYKVNPYIFIHRTLNKNNNPKKNSWNITHIPTGLAIKTSIKMAGSLDLKTLILLTEKWFPTWRVKSIGKKKNTTEEHIIAAKSLQEDIILYQEANSIWRV